MRTLLAAAHCPKGDVAGNLAAHLRLLTDTAFDWRPGVLTVDIPLAGSGVMSVP